MLEITDSVFGQMDYERRWIKKKNFYAFGKNQTIKVCAKVFNKKPITDSQRTSYLKMNAVSKIIVLLLMGCVAFSLFSCKFASIVNFESEDFEQFKANPISIDEYPDTFYYVRVMTAFQVQLIFRKFSKENDFSETLFQNISIFDDKGSELYKKERLKFASKILPQTLISSFFQKLAY